MTGKTETGGTTEELPEVAARSWAHPIANVPSDLTVRERHRLEAARSAVHGLFAQVEAVEVDVAAVQRMLDTVEKVPLQAFADGSIAFFALYNAMTCAEHLHDGIVHGPRLADLSGRRTDFVPVATARYEGQIAAARTAARKAAA